jgi:hypothetical protein
MVSYLLSLCLDLAEVLEWADFTDLTSPIASLLLNFVISSIAFSISAVRKLLGSEMSNYSYYSKLNFPPSALISF